MRNRLFFHLSGVVLLSMAVFAAFLQHPGLGDDFTYWKVGYGVAANVDGAWRADNFHDLRWPVWGMCWLFFKLTGSSMAAYYLPALTVLTLSALTVFLVARRMTGGLLFAWGAGALFLLHPLVDSVAYRPMPDLGEGLWTAFALLAWHAAMRGEGAWKKWGFSVLCGLFIAVAHSNRFTGLLLIPALGLLTLLFFPRRWPWMLVVVAAAVGFIAVECLVYQQVTGDFLHSLHTNMGAKGKKGTEAVNLFYLPFRFIDSLWKGGGSHLGPFYFIPAVLGGIALWLRRDARSRLPVAWAAVMFLAYSCALQQVWPPRPMLRDAERFLAALALPLSILTAAGWAAVWDGLKRLRGPQGAWLEAAGRRPVLLMLAGIAALAAISERERFDPDFVPEFRRYAASRPQGTKVLTHLSMWYFTRLVAQEHAERIDFSTKPNIYNRQPEVEKRAAAVDEIWFVRKLILLRPRKNLLDDEPDPVANLSSFLNSPQAQWHCAELLKIDDRPEVVFYQRRKPEDGAAVVLQSGDLKGMPAIPLEWAVEGKEQTCTIEVPEQLRGKRVRVRLLGRSNIPQPVSATLELTDGTRRVGWFESKPMFGKQDTVDFFNMEIPAEAVKANVRLRFDKKAKRVALDGLELVAD